ncbi:MAG TPA: hypothetical protein DIW30_07885 [Bacteroidales bacterium]|nr:hypothetical protein [Bacteroidales bacterium]
MNCRKLIFALLAMTASSLAAQELKSDDYQVKHKAEFRIKAEFNKTWFDKLSLGIDEEVRTVLGGSGSLSETSYSGGKPSPSSSLLEKKDIPAAFSKSYTTVSLTYRPLDYLALGGGYTLKLYGDKGWNDPKEFLRHRLFFFLTPQVKINQWKISLRERLDIDFRADSVNLNEKKKTEFALRSRLRVDYTMPDKPLRFHIGTEIVNTLNVPTGYLNQYATTADIPHYGQYISYVRPEVGIRWRLDRTNYLHFYYRFDYHYSRDVNITHKGANVELTHNSTYKHIIGIAYEFGM